MDDAVEPLRTAIVYDFDGTLAPGNIQEHRLLPEYLGVQKNEFWKRVSREKKKHNADQILVYLRLLLEAARACGKPLTEAVLRSYAKDTPLFEGVDSWFERINDHARARRLSLEHYVISSGNEEMIRGSSIGSQFVAVFGCRYQYDENGHAARPAVAINYTTKTQFYSESTRACSTALRTTT